MPNMPRKWRRWCYGTSLATLPLLTAYGVLDANKSAAFAALANAMFIGGLALRNSKENPS